MFVIDINASAIPERQCTVLWSPDLSMFLPVLDREGQSDIYMNILIFEIIMLTLLDYYTELPSFIHRVDNS